MLIDRFNFFFIPTNFQSRLKSRKNPMRDCIIVFTPNFKFWFIIHKAVFMLWNYFCSSRQICGIIFFFRILCDLNNYTKKVYITEVIVFVLLLNCTHASKNHISLKKKLYSFEKNPKKVTFTFMICLFVCKKHSFTFSTFKLYYLVTS